MDTTEIPGVKGIQTAKHYICKGCEFLIETEPTEPHHLCGHTESVRYYEPSLRIPKGSLMTPGGCPITRKQYRLNLRKQLAKRRKNI